MEIDCREKAANQTVHHIYEIEKIIPNKHIHYASIPSKVYIELPWKIIESHSNAYCYYNFKKTHDDATMLQLIIAIQFNNKLQKFFSSLVGGIIPWRNHEKEELNKLKELIENTASIGK